MNDLLERFGSDIRYDLETATLRKSKLSLIIIEPRAVHHANTKTAQ